jgi:hypothetical protein
VSERDDNLQSGLEGTASFQILHAAKQLIAGQLGVIAASRLLSHFCHEAEPKVAEVLLTFVGIDSETDALPIGAIRCNWSPEEQRW